MVYDVITPTGYQVWVCENRGRRAITRRVRVITVRRGPVSRLVYIY